MKEVKLNLKRYTTALDDLLDEAKQDVYVLGIDCNAIASPPNIVSDYIRKKDEENPNQKFAFHCLLLDPDSDYLKPSSKLYAETTIISEESKRSIETNRILLCRKKARPKREGKDPNRLEIRFYDRPLLHTAVVIDPESPTAKIQIESFLFMNDTEDRPSILVSKAEQPQLYEKYYKSFKHVLQTSRIHECSESESV